VGLLVLAAAALGLPGRAAGAAAGLLVLIAGAVLDAVVFLRLRAGLGTTCTGAGTGSGTESGTMTWTGSLTTGASGVVTWGWYGASSTGTAGAGTAGCGVRLNHLLKIALSIVFSYAIFTPKNHGTNI
jgi:hypothetical protein